MSRLSTSMFNVGRSKFNVLFCLWILASGFLNAQTQEELNSQLHLQAQPHFERLPTGEKMFSWLGQSGFSYFIQASPDLLDWTWAPNIEAGVDAPMSYEVDGPTAAGFFRLIRTDQTAADLDAADFDNDGLSNSFELTPRPRPGGIIGFNGLNPNIQSSPLKKDTDADGLDDKWELENGFDPTDDGTRLIDNGPNGDPDNDGVTNLSEQRLGTQPKGNATTTDSDGDGTLDFEDAVPGDNLVSWKRTAEGSYALIEIVTPYANPSPQDLNDKGEVLFSDGIWSGGNWLPRTAEDGTGAAPGDDGAPYTAHYEGWSRFNHDRKLIGTAHLTFTDGPAAGGDGIGSPAFWVQGQSSPSLLLDTAELWENVPNHSSPIGVTTDGSMVHLISPQPGTTSYLGRYSPTGSLVGQMTGSDGFHPNAQWHHADVTGTGWVASNLTRPASTGQSAAHKVGLWDTSNYPVALPAEAEGWGYPVRAKDLPNGKVVLIAGADNGTTTTGRVFLPNPTGQYEYATKLADKNIWLFAGDGSALTGDGKLWRNGELIPMADLCPRYKELLDAGNTIHPRRSNKNGTYLVQVESITEGSYTTSAALLVPVNTVLEESGDEPEEPSWLTAEASPKPEVEIAVTAAAIVGSDLKVTLSGTVIDRLSHYGNGAGESVHSLQITVSGVQIDTINLIGDVSAGVPFEKIVTIPNAKPRGYTIKATTNSNAAGQVGWDKVAVGANFEQTTSATTSSGKDFTLYFPEIPTATTADTAQVYFGNRAPLTTDPSATESSENSKEFTGTVTTLSNGQSQSVPCRIRIKGNLTFTSAAADSFESEVTYGLTTLPQNRLYGTWTETGPDTRIFKSSGYQGGGETLVVSAALELPGSPQEDFRPISLRLHGPDEWENSEDIRIKVGEVEYPLKKFTFAGRTALSPYDESRPDEPKLFLPSAGPVPARLVVPGYTPGQGKVDFKLKIGNSEQTIAAVQVQRGTRPIAPSSGSPALGSPPPEEAPPQQAPPAAAETGWSEPGDAVTWEDLLSAYEWIYGTDQSAMLLLRAYRENGNFISLKNEAGDLDVNYIWRTDGKIEIIIEHNDDDVNPVVCANLLYSGLYSALAYPPLNNHPEVRSNNELVESARSAFGIKAAEITATTAELHLSGATIVSEPLDWLIIINDVNDGHYESVAGLLPFVPAGAIKATKPLRIANKAGHLLGEISDPLQIEAIARASRKRAFNDKIVILEEAGISDEMIAILAKGDELLASKSRANLKKRMLKVANEPPPRGFEAHHDLPWEFRQRFAEAKLDVNDPQFGRWAHPDDHSRWHNEDPKFNDFWEDFFYGEPVNGARPEIARTKAEVVQKLQEARDIYTITITGN